jgi:outer membrane protein assembly factor BamD
MRRRHLVGLGLGLAVIALGCATKKPIVPPEKLWSEAEEAYHDEAYELAVQRYKALLDQHPFDPRAEEAELKIAQSHYYNQRYAEAIAAFGDFERMHPTSPELPSVEYYLGMSYLAQASTSDRDQQGHTNALTYFRNLIDRFPNSPWAEKARLRVRECQEALAMHEANIARYYLKMRNLKAAEARLRGLLTEYPDTDATAEALYAFAEAYAARDEAEGATLALATLVRHHPGTPVGREAQQRLGDAKIGLDGDDPLPLLVARLDRMREQADRQKLPTTVSAYPDIAGPDGTAR